MLYGIAALLLAACTLSPKTEVPIQTGVVDCEAAWLQENASESKDIAFFLNLEKSRFKINEPIFSTLILKNIGVVPYWVNKRMIINRPSLGDAGEVYFVINSPWGETADLIAKVDAMAPVVQDFVQLGPQQTIDTQSEGIMLYSYLSTWGSEGKNIDLRGKYCVWAVYHNQADPGLLGQVWKGKIKSNFVEFEITK
jgi:hypothetical protein